MHTPRDSPGEILINRNKTLTKSAEVEATKIQKNHFKILFFVHLSAFSQPFVPFVVGVGFVRFVSLIIAVMKTNRKQFFKLSCCTLNCKRKQTRIKKNPN